jgi:hypothetical protein
MRSLRTTFAWISLGAFGAATAAAQSSDPTGGTGVILCRPRPLTAPATPAFVVRGQMEDARDSGGAAAADTLPQPRGTPVAQVSSPAQAQATPAQLPAPPVKAASPTSTTATKLPDSTRVVAPPPRNLAANNPWAAIVEGLPTNAGPIYIYDTTGELDPPPGPNPRFYARGDYLLWWTRGYHLPLLVTTSPATTPQAQQGVLGVPGTAPVIGDSTTSSGPQSGARFTVGWNFNPCSGDSIEASYFFLGRKNDNLGADSSQFPVLARPFFDVNTGTQFRELVASPGINAGDLVKLRGSVAVNNFSDLQGAELNYRRCLCTDCNYSAFAFVGFRYLDLHEGLSITESEVSAQAVAGFPALNPGNLITVNDSFGTRNRFFGGQLGLEGEIRRGSWFVGGKIQVGLGVTNENIDINGSQTITTLTGQRSTFFGGLLALPSNIGSVSQNRFSVVPQVGLKVGYNVTENVRIYVGYDFLYWSNVVRPGDQIDTSLNTQQIPNSGTSPPSNIVRPVVPFTTSSYFAHGINAGLEWRY